MKDEDCVAFLRWCLPHLGLRWPGFRKVRRTVCKRVRRRLTDLGLGDLDAYRAYLAEQDEEWERLATFCRIPISRFWRDRAVFSCLADKVLPVLADDARWKGQSEVTAWCAGCASGEEAYSLRLAWSMRAENASSAMGIRILGTDADETMLERAKAGIYAAGSLKELPESLRQEAFDILGDNLAIKPFYRTGISFRLGDIREEMPDGPFDLVLCRNLAFTYFDEAGQEAVLEGIRRRLRPGGLMVIGSHEALPPDGGIFEPWTRGLPIYRLGEGASDNHVVDQVLQVSE